MMSLSEILSETAQTAKKKKNKLKEKGICFLKQEEPVPRKGRV